MDDAGDGERTSNPRSAARRARLARRVATALSNLPEGATLVADTETSAIRMDDYRPADYVIQYLDLRIRLVLLLECRSDAGLQTEPILKSAHLLLRHWPDTYAVALVADDDDLSTVIVDAFESAEALEAPSGERKHPLATTLPAPLDATIGEFLRTAVPEWNPIALAGTPTASAPMSDFISEAVATALDQVKSDAESARIPEKKAAFREVATSDRRWLDELVRKVVGSEATHIDIEGEVNRRGSKS